MIKRSPPPRRGGFVYNLFIFALAVFSLFIMLAMLAPIDELTLQLLQSYDTLICIFFIIDFFLNLRAAPSKSKYFLKEGGWLDLLGSIPILGLGSKVFVLFRLARLSRIFRIARLQRGKRREDYVQDVLEHRTRYTGFITIFLAIMILATASVLVLQFESSSPKASIKTGWDAFWYSIVTITTVGYGDYSPVTVGGRITAIFIMVAGVGIIGTLASLLSSLLLSRVPGGSDEEQRHEASVEQELTAIRQELADLRALLEKTSAEEIKK